jgi:hypothetical protein
MHGKTDAVFVTLWSRSSPKIFESSPYLKENTTLHHYKHGSIKAVHGSNPCLHGEPYRAHYTIQNFWQLKLLVRIFKFNIFCVKQKWKESKVVPLSPCSLQGGEEVYPLFIVYLGISWGGGWVVSVMPRPPFILGEVPQVPIGQETGWTSEMVWTQCREEKYFASAGSRTLVVQSIVSFHTELLGKYLQNLKFKKRNYCVQETVLSYIIHGALWLVNKSMEL